MFWWPFSRKRRKQKRSQSAEPIEEKSFTVVRSQPTTSSSAAAPVDMAGKGRAATEPPPSTFNERDSSPLVPPAATWQQQQQQQQQQQLASKASNEDITALPFHQQRDRSPHLRSIPEADPIRRDTRGRSKKSLNDQGLQRRKSSKRRKEDEQRLQVLRSDTAPINIPSRADTDTPTLGRQHSKRKSMKRQLPNLGSAVSLTTAPSVRSSVTGVSELNHFEIGSMDVFSPRPTIRYSLHSAYASPSQTAAHSRSESKAEKDKPPPSRRTLKESKTIDDFADDMDTRTLRELMERDKRRRERKERRDKERAGKKLERHASRTEQESPTKGKGKIRQVVADDELQGTVKSPFDGKDSAGPSSPVVRRRKSETDDARLQTREETTKPFIPNPFIDAEETSMRSASRSENADYEIPFTDQAAAETPPVRSSQTSPSPPASPPHRHTRKPSNLSHVTDLPATPTQEVAETVEPPDSGRRASQTSARKGIAALFRRGQQRDKRASEDIPPSEISFSNTSRESMSRQPIPAHLVGDRPVPPRRASGTPVRTKSKFREDLPEMPALPSLSKFDPQDGAGDVPPVPENKGKGRQIQPIVTSELGLAEDQEDPGSAAPVSATMLSQSLASVDSEGSWLSGRPRKRTSQQMSTGRASLTRRPLEFTGSFEELGLIEGTAEQRAGLTSETAGRGSNEGGRKEELPSPAEEGEDKVVRGEIARSPTIIDRPRVKSNEGLLREYLESEATGEAAVVHNTEEGDLGEENTELDEGGERNEEEAGSDETSATNTDTNTDAPVIERATSVSRTHARQMSAGSARLLDIIRGDPQRFSQSPSPTPPEGSSSRPGSSAQQHEEPK